MSRQTKGVSSPCTASTSQESHQNSSSKSSNKTLRVTLLSSEWRSTKGGLSTFNRELAIQLAEHPSVEVSVYLPQCSEKDKKDAENRSVHLIEAEEMIGFKEPNIWLALLPKDHVVDCVIGHGVVLGRQVQFIKRTHPHCKWIQVAHTAPEELGMYKGYEKRISKGEKKHQDEVELCKLADQVVAVGPKLAEAFSRYLRPCGKDRDVLNFTPGIFSEFADVKQATEEGKSFNVLVFGRGDSEDFQLKGYDIAAEAIVELKDMSYKLVFVGATSGEEEKVAEMFFHHGIHRNQLTVRCFDESRKKLADLFCEVDLAIMPSRTEGFGLAALEALSAGLPVLVNGNSGFGEALKEVPYGSSWVVDSEDPKDWATAIRGVREKNRKLRLKESKFLRGEYAEMYSWQGHCNTLVERMLTFCQGDNTEERDYLCKGSPERNHLPQSGKRPLSPSPSSPSKQPRLLRDEGNRRQLCPEVKYMPKIKRRKSRKKIKKIKKKRGSDNSVVVKLLKAEYKRRSQLRPLLWDNTIELPLESVYTRLKIVSRGKFAVHMEDNEVNVFDIFSALVNGEDVMTLVEGGPGIGKTTFCLKLAYDWAHGKIPIECSFPKFEFVLLLKCRDIHEDIMETISEQLLPEDIAEETKEKLFDFIKDIHNQEKTLIILDGLDELPQESQRFVDKLLQRRVLSFCYVLATSRQERGIDVRKTFCFDILLEIKGFTEDDAFKYITKHFENIGTLHSPKGERLINEIKENTLLHALRNNPLNLLLLCVIYEDYEGNLPSSRSELYQVIVQCLLRRYCAKRNLEAPEDNSDLERKFEKDILALGELAWMCLQSDRYCFRETELAVLESRYKELVARDIGLLYKEESLKRLKPQHEYHFLHKTFQEYLAAAYIAHKLRANELNLFERLSFHNLVARYGQVFLFVSGMLGKEATILFKQIGEEIINWGHWDWDSCRQLVVNGLDEEPGLRVAEFLAESFRESRNDEEMAVTLCSYIPFPQHLTIEPDSSGNIFHVLKACKSFQKLKQPVEVTIFGPFDLYETVTENLQSLSQLQTLTIRTVAMTSKLANALREGLSGSTTVSEITLEMCGNFRGEAAVVIGELLAASKSLKKITFVLDRAWGKGWAAAIETGLSANNLLTSVVLNFPLSLSDAAVHALGKLSSNKALTSLSLNIYGDMQDVLFDQISNGIARQTTLKSLNLSIDGNLSLVGAQSLKSGLLKNRSLTDLKVSIRGKLPDYWQFVVEDIRLAKTASVNLGFHPDSCSKTHNQMAYFYSCPRDVVEQGSQTKQHLTVVLWSEISFNEAEALCQVWACTALTSLTLKVHGKLRDGVADHIARFLRQHNTLSPLTIDVWGELSSETCTILQGLSDEFVEVKLHDLRTVPYESCNCYELSIDSSASLRQVLPKVKDTRNEKLIIKVSNDYKGIKDWTHLLADAFAENTSLTALDLTIDSHMRNERFLKGLEDSFFRCSSLTVLSLTVNNHREMKKGWECRLVESLSNLTLLTTLSVAIDDHGELREYLGRRVDDGLRALNSLSALSIVINGSYLEVFWSSFLRSCLKENTSLTVLCITVNNYYSQHQFDYDYDDYYKIYDDDDDYYNQDNYDNYDDDYKIYDDDDGDDHYPLGECWYKGLGDGLAKTTSLNELTLTINYVTFRDAVRVSSVYEGLAKNKSLTTLNVTVSSNSDSSDWVLWVSKLNEGLRENNSITTLTLIMNNYSEGVSRHFWGFPWRIKNDSVENASLTTLNVTINMCSEVGEGWLAHFCDAFVNYSSLTTLRLTVNNHCSTGKSRIYDFSKLRLKYRSLSSFELTVFFYGE